VTFDANFPSRACNSLDVNVYIIGINRDDGIGGPCKVGISNNVRGRLLNLQCASPFELKVFRTFRMPSREIAIEIEQCFHKTQVKNRLRGEWFDLSPEDVCITLILQISWAIDFLTDLSKSEKKAALWMVGIEELG
jgi:Meiotically up-regulated gene 113